MNVGVQAFLRSRVLLVTVLWPALGAPTILHAAEDAEHQTDARTRDKSAPIVLPTWQTAFSVTNAARNSDMGGDSRNSSLAAGDIDGDGVPDVTDVCDNTPLGSAVDSRGRPLGDIDEDCDTDLMDHALFQRGMTGPLPEPDFGVCNPLAAVTGCSAGDNCYVVLGTTDPTLCASEFTAGTQGDACEFINACMGGYGCVLSNAPVNSTGMDCAFICDASGGDGPTCADGPGQAFQCAPINGFYGNIPDFPGEIGMCVDPAEWSVFDLDGDGVLDFTDLCPGTPAGSPVDSDGCPVVIGACCLAPNACCQDDTDQSSCNGVGGTFQGEGTSCAMGCNGP